MVKQGRRQQWLSQARPHMPRAVGVTEDRVAIQDPTPLKASANHASPCPFRSRREEGRGERVAWLASI
jgi:hypothetical protein